MTEDESRGDDVIKPPAPNSPKYSKEIWDRARTDFETGNYKSIRELARTYGINEKTFDGRIRLEGWVERQRALSGKVEAKLEKVLVTEAENHLKETFLVTKKYRKMIDASQEFSGSKAPDGTPLLDPDALDTYTRTEVRIHELAKSALRIVDSKNVDVTSGGQSIAANFTEAVKKLREMATTEALPELTDEEIEKLKDCRIEGEEGATG